MFRWLCVALLAVPVLLPAQTKTEFQQILERLDRLERENHGLAEEVRALREELAAARSKDSLTTSAAAESGSPQTVDDRLGVVERRVDEQAQTKVEASQRLPVTLTGTVLFNAFMNGRFSAGTQGPQQNPVVASLTPGQQYDGGTLRQTVIGLKFQGPEIFGGGRINGSVYMDFFGGTTSSLNHLVRLRVASVEADWKSTSILFGQEKPIIAPREPNSLAQVGVSPLTGAGNLWLWGPQVRLEQRFQFGSQTSLRAQVGVYQTSEPPIFDPILASEYSATLSTSRPALEGRFELTRRWGESKRIEIAPGFHFSDTHVVGQTAPSRLFTVDWMLEPISLVQFSGTFFTGKNAAGVGGLRQGFSIFAYKRVVAIPATGGWAQLSLLATRRLSFNMYGGQESDRPSDLLNGNISRNLAYAANLIYRFGPNVLAGLEASQVRTTYVGSGLRINNHYDLGLAYLF